MPDSQPNYLTIAPTGETSASFSGGVDMPLGTGSYPTTWGNDPAKAIRWRRESDGYVAAYDSATINTDSIGFPIGTVTAAKNVKNPTNGRDIGLVLVAEGSPSNRVAIQTMGLANVGVEATNVGRQLIDNQGKSSWIQAAYGNPAKIMVGNYIATGNMSVAAVSSTSFLYNHGLPAGASLIIPFGTMIDQAGVSHGSWFGWSAYSITATQVWLYFVNHHTSATLGAAWWGTTIGWYP